MRTGRRIGPALLIAALLSVSAVPVARGETTAVPSGAPPAAAAGSLETLAGIEKAEDLFVQAQGRGGNRSGRASGEDPSWENFLVWLIPVFLILGLINLVRAIKARRRYSSFAGGVTAVRDLKDGTAMVTGTVEAAEHLVSPVTNEACVHYDYEIHEDWHRTRIQRVKETVSTFDGSMYDGMGGYRGSRDVWRDEVKEEAGTKRVASDSQAVPFTVNDGTGEVVVLPDRADFVGVTTFNDKVDASDPHYAVAGVDGLRDSAGTRQLSEAVVRVGDVVTVMGPVETENGAPRMRWTRTLGPSAKRRFLVTVEDPSGAERSERRQMIRRFVRATAYLAATIVIVALNADWTGPGA